MPAGGHRPPRPASMRGDAAAGDIVGNLLLVGLTVALGAVVAIVVTSSLAIEDSVADAAFRAEPVPVGANEAAVMLNLGRPVPLESLRVARAVNNGPFVDVPRAAWRTDDPEVLRAGERIAFDLPAPAQARDLVTIRVYHTSSNRLLAQVGVRVPGLIEAPAQATLTGTITPGSLPADALTTGLVEVRVSHPQGAAAIARVVVDLANITTRAGSAPILVDLRDDGHEGDLVGGDGIWAGVVRIPARTPPETYHLAVNLTDTQGRRAGIATIPVVVTLAPGAGWSSDGNTDGGGSGSGGSEDGTGGGGSGGGSGSGGSGGFEEPLRFGRRLVAEGTQLPFPTSSNITKFTMRNWTIDPKHPQRVDKDYFLFYVLGKDRTWTGYIQFGWHQQTQTTRFLHLRVWHGGGDTTYSAPGVNGLPLQGFELDLLNPIASGLQVTTSADSNAPHPTALYDRASVQQAPLFVLAQVADTSSASGPQLGLLGVEVEYQ